MTQRHEQPLTQGDFFKTGLFLRSGPENAFSGSALSPLTGRFSTAVGKPVSVLSQ